jgi:predicted nuclease of restriction endonuclease-like (RecB) superfamily
MKRRAKRSESNVSTRHYTRLLGEVSQLLEEARRAAARSVNAILTVVYWELGRRIVEHEQRGRRAAYGSELLRRLAKDLTARFGRGFGLSNLKQIRKFYLTYSDRGKGQTVLGLFNAPSEDKKGQTASDLLPSDLSHTETGPILHALAAQFPLSWSHYVRLISLDDPHKRDFYEEEAGRGGWSVRQLDRQINAMLYERLGMSREKGRLLEEAERAATPATAEEQIKDPYILEFLGLPEPYSEKELEEALIGRLADFLLELGYGFTFVARQKRFQIGGESYYLDLLFYHRGLRCLVAIDLKVGKFTHADAGQMNLYLNYLAENEMMDDEAPPVGLILCSEKDEAVARYALGGLSNKVFASRYELQLPDPEILKREIEAERRRLETPIAAKSEPKQLSQRSRKRRGTKK